LKIASLVAEPKEDEFSDVAMLDHPPGRKNARSGIGWRFVGLGGG
jgi:hypothetical protein